MRLPANPPAALVPDLQAVARIIDTSGFPLDPDAVVAPLGAGMEATAFGAESGGHAVVLKHYWEWSPALDYAALILAEQDRVGAPIHGVAQVLAVLGTSDDRDGWIVIQERVHRLEELDLRGYPPVGDVAAPVLAEALEDAVNVLLDGMLDEVDLEGWGSVFQGDLQTGAAAFGDARLDVLDWTHDNVGIIERDGRPQAVIIDTGLWG